MNVAVMRQSLRQARRTIFALTAATGAFYYLVLLASSSFLKAGSAGLGSFFQNPPKSVSAFLGGSVDFLRPAGWLSAAMGHPITIALMAGAAFAVSAGAVATEIERGTIDLVLSRPVGRIPFLMGKAAAAIVAVTAAEVGGLIGVLVARATITRMNEIPLTDVLVAFAGSWVLFAAFSMIGLLVSAVTSLRGRATGLAVGIVVAAFFVNFIALLIEEVSPIRFLSPFHYFDSTHLMARQETWTLLVLAGLGAVGLTLALAWFAHRDLTH